MNNISGEFQIGGLLGGTAMAWLVGRHWKFEYTTRYGWRVDLRGQLQLLCFCVGETNADGFD